MKTTNFRTVEELNLDVNAPAVTPTKVQNDKIVRPLKKLFVTDPDAGRESASQIVKLVGTAAEKPPPSFWVVGSDSPGGG